MRIYIIPNLRVHFPRNILPGGAEKSIFNQIEIFKEGGHQVRLFISSGDIQINGVDVYSKENISSYNFTKEKHRIVLKLVDCIGRFKPDLIIDNTGTFKNWLHLKLVNFGKPILFVSHCMPGGMSDLSASSKFKRWHDMGHSITCTSEYHKNGWTHFYSKTRRFSHNPIPNILVDYVTYPAYCNKEIVKNSILKMSTISRASSNKGTFFPHKMLKESDIISEVFTNSLSDRINRDDFVPDRHSFFAETSKQENYLKTNLEEYENVSNTKTNFDKPHVEIMQSITNSAAFFVGLAPYDTFTITSLEALSKGIPLLVRSKNNFHPAMEMVEDEFNRYIYCFKTKSDFVEKIKEFSNMTLEERQNLANSCYIKMNRNEFKKKWNYAIENTVKKYYDTVTKVTLKEFCEDNINYTI